MASPASLFDLSAKTVLVTGAGFGLGRAFARALASHGAEVVAADVDFLGAEQTSQLIVQEGGKSSPLAVDVADEKSVAAMAAAVGRVEVLVNNAGIASLVKRVHEMTTEEWNRVIAVDLTGVFFVTRAILPKMLAQGGGTIVNVSSMSAKVSPPRETAYAASKCAMEGFTAGLWNDLAGSNIHVALVIPGPIDTEIWEKDETPSGYNGRKHPPRIVTAAIREAIEKRRHEIIVPKRSPQLVAARLLRFLAPSLLRAGMAWMEPVPADVVERARARARQSR
jgi:NAD(P)-dependent dehydrogenase (short-subunit alcohol dehydrogenase family)